MKKTSLLALLSAFAVGSSVHATIFLAEPFDYPDGDLTNVSSGLWNAHSGTGSPILVNSGSITLDQGSGSREDVNSDLGLSMGAGDQWFYSFDVSVSGSSSDVYFASLLQGSSFYEGRLFVTAPASTGDYTFGISGGSSSPVATWGSDFSFGTTHRVVVSYDFDSTNVTLWVDPSSEASTSISDNSAPFQDSPSAISFRQASPTTPNSQIIDNLVVADSFQEALTGVAVPEPSSLSLMGISGLALVGFGYKRLRFKRTT